MVDSESRDSLIFNSSPVAVVAIVKIVVSNPAPPHWYPLYTKIVLL